MNTICYDTQFHSEVSAYINKYRLDTDTTLPYRRQFSKPIYKVYKRRKRVIDSLIEQYKTIITNLSEVEILQIILCYSNEKFLAATRKLERISLQDDAALLKSQRFNNILLKYELLSYCSMPLGQKRRNIYRYFSEFFRMSLTEVNHLLYDLLQRDDIQIYKNYVELKVKQPEEKFRYLLETYYIPDQWLKDIFGLSDESIAYFNENFNRGFISPQKMIRDFLLSVHLKRLFTTYIEDKVCDIDGERIISTKLDIIQELLKGYGDAETNMVGLYVDYENVTESAPNNDELAFETLNDFEEFVEKLPFVLWTSDHYFRYCDLTLLDIHFIISNIDFEKYNNSEISVELLYKDNRALLEKFGIFNDSELFYLLVLNKDTIKVINVDFKRDSLDRAEDESEPIYQSISKPKSPDIVKTPGKDVLIDEEIAKIKPLIEEPIYSLNQFKTIIQSVVGGKLGHKVTFSNIRLLGCERIGSLVHRSEFKSIDEAVEKYLEQFDILNFARQDEELLRHDKVQYVLKDLQYRFKLIEFAPKSYIALRKFTEAGLSKKDIFDYIDSVEAFTEGRNFTTVWLKNNGFKSPLDLLGFDTYFYDSILKYSNRFSYNPIDKTILFCKGVESATLAKSIEEIVNPLNAVEIYDLIEILRLDFGVNVTEKQLILAVKKKKNTELYYNDIKEKVYKDYDTYYDEI